MVIKLDKIFDSFIENKIFQNKSVLQINYTPDNIPHRDNEIENVASILAPALRGERTSNLFVYGRTGTGKTLCLQYVSNEMMRRAAEAAGNVAEGEANGVNVVYVNCKLKKVADTEYRILAELIRVLGGKVASTGLPTDSLYNKFVELVDQRKQIVIIVLDEIDQAVKRISDGFLYSLTRINQELKRAQISIVGVSNNLNFMDNIDPRVRSSLGEEELIFPPYNALQLQEILRKRSAQAFSAGVLGDGVLSKCAAFAAREHGDARRALDLLRVAGEVAQREGADKVLLAHIDKANEKIERDRILYTIENEPKQFQLVLLAIIELNMDKDYQKVFTGDIYNKYQEICENTRNDILTQRRVSDMIAEFDMLGIINANVISKGREGRTKEIKLMIPPNVVDKAKQILIDGIGK